jgi:preprotein translocase subunit SecE
MNHRGHVETPMVFVMVAIAAVFFVLADPIMHGSITVILGIGDFLVLADQIMQGVVAFILGIGG